MACQTYAKGRLLHWDLNPLQRCVVSQRSIHCTTADTKRTIRYSLVDVASVGRTIFSSVAVVGDIYYPEVFSLVTVRCQKYAHQDRQLNTKLIVVKHKIGYIYCKFADILHVYNKLPKFCQNLLSGSQVMGEHRIEYAVTN